MLIGPRDPLLRTVGKFTAGDHGQKIFPRDTYLTLCTCMSIIHVRCPRLIMTEEWCSMMPVNYGRIKEDSHHSTVYAQSLHGTEILGYAKTARRK